MKITEHFRQALENHPSPLYLLAPKAGFHPARLSRIKNGEEIKRPHDIRLKILAELVDYNGPLFEEITSKKQGRGCDQLS